MFVRLPRRRARTLDVEALIVAGAPLGAVLVPRERCLQPRQLRPKVPAEALLVPWLVAPLLGAPRLPGLEQLVDADRPVWPDVAPILNERADRRAKVL